MSARDEFFRSTVDQLHEGIQVLDRSWRYVYVNEAAARHGRSEKSQLEGRKMMEVYPGIEGTEMFRLLKRTMDRRHPGRMDNQFVYSDGSKAWFSLYFEPHVDGILIRSVDISETKRMEEQYLHSQKMDAIGRLAGGIAHDFNNKLSIVRLYTDIAMSEIGSQNPTVVSHLTKVVRAVETASKLTRQLLAFSRKQVLDLKVMNMNDLVTSFADGLVKLLGGNVRLKIDLDPSLGNVFADANQFDQVLMNLAFNARDAMPNGGLLTFETANVELDQTFCESRQGLSPGSYVMLSVSDTGTGMSAETKSKIFEPFFTTKPIGSGTGLGLSSVFGIVQQSRGHVWVYSELDIGTTFKIYLPRVSELAEAIDYDPEPDQNLRGTETVLLVEDEETLRAALVRSLETAGYTVLAAESVGAAKAHFMESKGNVDLLLTDLVLGADKGHDLAKDLAALKMDLKIAFMSGYTENTIAHQGVLDDNAILIQKPVSMRKLLSTVRSVLDGHLKKGVV